MPEFWSEFQFLRPWWLCALPVLAIWFSIHLSTLRSAGWLGLIPDDKLKFLQIASGNRRGLCLYFAALAIAVISLAGPGSGLQPGVAGNTADVRVFVLDLSPSMLARDIKPDRLSIARLKLIDLLRLQKDRESALVVYADDAYQVTPLTDDPNTIEALVPTLHPEIMPAMGSHTESAVRLAQKLIRDGGYNGGDIVLITDGVPAVAIQNIRGNWSSAFRLSILAVGTAAGAPVPIAGDDSRLSAGGFLVDESKNIVVARVNSGDLKSLTNFTGGRYSMVTTDSADVDSIDAIGRWSGQIKKRRDQADFDRSHDAGYWLVLILIPFAVSLFRKNVLWVLTPFVLVAPDSHAFEWRDLWLNEDQRAQRAYAEKNYEKASKLFANLKWKAVSHYQQGEYAAAVELLSAPEYADDFYNRGNAQALSGDPKAAIVSYRLALQLYQSDQAREDVLYNIRVLRHLLDQVKEPEQEDQNGGGASEGVENGDNAEAAPAMQSESSGEQSGIGGATGAGSTLRQQSLQEQSSSNTAAGEPDTSVADDATSNAEQPADTSFIDSAATDNSDQIEIEENNNKVMSPYSEQWLRELPVDPGGYLRRKFGYQAQLRRGVKQAENTDQEFRY